MVGNQASSFHHIYEPGWDYQAEPKLPARSEVPNSALPEVDHYLMPGLELGRNPCKIYRRAAQIPEVPEEYPVD